MCVCIRVFSRPADQIVRIFICFKRRNHWNSWENHHIHQLLSDRRKRSTTTLGWQSFPGTGMKTTLTLESLASQCDLRLADSLVPGWGTGVGNKTKIRGRKWVISKEVGNIPRDILNAILGHKLITLLLKTSSVYQSLRSTGSNFYFYFYFLNFYSGINPKSAGTVNIT